MKQLDEYQMSVVNENKNLLVIAGPGAGKTTTIVFKIKKLLQTCLPKDILVISFTNKSVDDLKIKINDQIKILTFHKLAIDIFKYNNQSYTLCSSNLLEYIIDEYILSLSKKEKKILCRYLNITKLSKDNYQNLKNLIITFINLFKTNNHDFKKLNQMIKNYPDKYLIEFILKILYIYENEKKSTRTYDFDDLIVNATTLLKKKYNYYKFKYIIIDEFQDTSLIRLNLIKEIYRNSHAIITAVGDDAQSIFHFTGCDLNIFLNFTKYFENSKIIKLKYTYRNSQQLIDITTRFINKNPKQIKKDMISIKKDDKPIEYIYYFNGYFALKRLLNKFKNKNVMILSRNKRDIFSYLGKEIIYKDNKVFFKNSIFDFLTIHSSKGLESDYVIILNVSNKKYGIPNQIIDHPILKYVNNEIDSFPFAEERRIFFVALTRCKEKVFLLIPFSSKSKFIKELKTN